MDWWDPATAPFADNIPCKDCLRVGGDFVLRRPSTPDGTVARVGNVRKSFGRVTALDDVTFEVQRGEILGIIGRRGAGKSTLIRCLNGLEKPDRGRVDVLGCDIVSLPERSLRQVRRQIGMIFPHFNLLSAKTVAENVALPLKIAGVPAQEREFRVQDVLALVGLSDKASVYPAGLSGGEKQRAGIARALTTEPALLLCDEPTGALDLEATQSILDLLRDINRRLGLTIVLATHDTNVIRTIADRLIVLEHGRIVEEGEVWRVFTAPEAEPTERLIGGQSNELPSAIRNGLRNEWTRGTDLVLRVQLSGDAAHNPVLSQLTRDLEVLPVVLDASVQRIQDCALASFTIAIRDPGEPLALRIAEYLASRVSRLEVLGYAQQLA
jgi:D-methionine transport system ATP-binding protein